MKKCVRACQTSGPLEELEGVVDFVEHQKGETKIHLKSFSPDYYWKNSGAPLSVRCGDIMRIFISKGTKIRAYEVLDSESPNSSVLERGIQKKYSFHDR